MAKLIRMNSEMAANLENLTHCYKFQRTWGEDNIEYGIKMNWIYNGEEYEYCDKETRDAKFEEIIKLTSTEEVEVMPHVETRVEQADDNHHFFRTSKRHMVNKEKVRYVETDERSSKLPDGSDVRYFEIIVHFAENDKLVLTYTNDEIRDAVFESFSE